MIDHSTSHPILPRKGDLWTNTLGDGTLFIIDRDERISGIWSDGRPEDEEVLMRLEHGREGWMRIYPPLQVED